MKPIVVIALILILCSITIGAYGKKSRKRSHSFSKHGNRYLSGLRIRGQDLFGPRRKSTRYNRPQYYILKALDLEDFSESNSAFDSSSDSGSDSRSDNDDDYDPHHGSINKQDSYLDSGEESEPDSREDETPDEIEFNSSYEAHRLRLCFGSRCPPSKFNSPWLKTSTAIFIAPWITRSSRPKPWSPKPTKITPKQRQSRLTTVRGNTEWGQTTTPIDLNTRSSPRPKPRPTTSSGKTRRPTTTRKPKPIRTTLIDRITKVPITTATPTKETITSTQEMKPTTLTFPKAILDCIDNCVTTPEYNPVCGTDGETYDNIDHLICAKNCGVNVDLKRNSVCPFTHRPRPDDVELDGNGGAGRKMEFFCDKSCAACDQRGQTMTSTTTTTFKPTVLTTTSGDIDRSTSTTSMEQCVRACPLTPEYNPVCGTNGVTYSNPGYLLCAQLCGKNVQIRQFTSCPTVATTDSPTMNHDETKVETTVGPAVKACIRKCPMTSEYKPICGTNDWTYENLGRLWCVKDCGVNVDLLHNGTCFDLNPTLTLTGAGFWSTSTSITKNKYTESTNLWTSERPTTKSTPISTTSLWNSSTTIERSSVTSPSRASPTTLQWTTPTSTSTTGWPPLISSSTIRSTSFTLDFTIPSDLLAYIFGEITTTSTTQPTVLKYENIDDAQPYLDPRFGDD